MSNTIEQRIADNAAKLSREIAPERDLWPGIEAAISEPAEEALPERSRWMPYFAQAAAVVVLVAGSSLLTYQLTRQEAQVSPVVTTTAFDTEFISFGEDVSLSPSFENARNDVAAKLDVALEELSPEARAEVERNLAVIRGAVAEIKAALQNEPDSKLLQEMLNDAYRQELSLMRDVRGLTQSVMSRNDI